MNFNKINNLPIISVNFVFRFQWISVSIRDKTLRIINIFDFQIIDSSANLEKFQRM